MTLRFDDRVAIVTGAGQGLGRAYVLELAKRGARIVINDLGDAEYPGASDIVETVVDEIKRLGGTAIAVTGSVDKSEQAERTVGEAIQTFGRIDILINNAGFGRARSIEKLTDSDFADLLQVHLWGSMYFSRAVWPYMREQGYGRILNTTSSVGLLGSPTQSNYASAKAALVGLTKVLALEGSDAGIQANAIAPMARTRMTEATLRPEDGTTEAGDLDMRRRVFETLSTALKFLDPALVTPVAAWLVHEQCPATGEVYGAAGGRVTRFFTGMTSGYYCAELTAEDVQEHFDNIRDAGEYVELHSSAEEMANLTDFLVSVGAQPRQW